MLHEAALAYLARSAATAAGVKKTLERRVANWAQRAVRSGRDVETVENEASRAREAIAPVVARLREVGLVNDAAFANARARSLSRSGRSRRAIEAHLTAKGASEEIVREALPNRHEDELGAAITFARKRRLGPFARERDELTAADRQAAKQKALATMARAGFDFRTSDRVLRMDLEQAEEHLREHRRGEF
ncbi:Regulatory protein recX [Labilithrix luteola]|uniref:Regulatory protein RecX n=1 Tax=Labilithrix luteola TaxID=1391654 RepID=A0A0K1QE33_9BACT|nr:Regulatory protein recX [Labilithrix luteola]